MMAESVWQRSVRMTSHWPTFADGLFWCACDNRTFDSEEAWLAHVVNDSGLASLARDYLDATYNCFAPDKEFDRVVVSREALMAFLDAQPPESSSGHAAPSR